MPESKPYTIKGADGSLEIAAGEYYVNTKARCRTLQRNVLTNEARRVYAALELATMGFQQELAVLMRKGGKITPLTTTDLEIQTGLDRRQVRRALDELDNQGLGERRPIDPQKGLQKGNVAIYSRALPQSPNHSQERGHARPPKFLSDSKERSCLVAFARRHRLPVPNFEDLSSDYLEQLERVARDLQIAEEEAARILKTGTRAAAHNKEEIKRNIEEKDSGRAGGSETVVTEAPPAPDPPPFSARPPAIPFPSKPKPNPEPIPPEEIPRFVSVFDDPLYRTWGRSPESVQALIYFEDWLNTHGRIGTKIDPAMFYKIASALSRPELIEQFKTEALKIDNPRKYAVYETVARQVTARGPVQPTADRETREQRQAREFREQYRADERRKKDGHK